MNPCPYCETMKAELALKSGNPRTVGNIKQNITRNTTTKDRVASCVHEPLVPGEDDTTILEICPPPPLHLTLGITNAIFKAVEKKNPDWADLWINDANVRHQQRAYGFTGRACHSLLKNSGVLQQNEATVEYFEVIEILPDYSVIQTQYFLFTGLPTFYERIHQVLLI